MLTRIKLRRLERDLPQVVVAQRADIPRARLSEIECGYIEARPDELARIARVLGVPVDTLSAGRSG
jgi:transcriptional regulator with XRE-family HTH domain